jgi:penicillin V acylase-like amidase (Ntn superfamily)
VVAPSFEMNEKGLTVGLFYQPGFAEYQKYETNLRNYINVSPVAFPGKTIEHLDFKPLGGGSGMIGLPGDFAPRSRFVRAVAFSKSARPTKSGDETVYELFGIFDNSKVPLGLRKARETIRPRVCAAPRR